MQAVVYHRFAYTSCTASLQPICKMATISFKTQTDRTFSAWMLQNACADKGSVFLQISVICRVVFINVSFVEGAIRLEKCSNFRLFVPKSVTSLNYSLGKCNQLSKIFGQLPLSQALLELLSALKQQLMVRPFQPGG